MNDSFNVLLIYILEFPFPYSGTGAAASGTWHDEVWHTVGLLRLQY